MFFGFCLCAGGNYITKIKAVALVNDNRSVWKEFIEATKVVKLSFKTLREGEFEIALYTLWQLHKNKEDREMSSILEYLAYRRESNK